jgi:hypothetical protein
MKRRDLSSLDTRSEPSQRRVVCFAAKREPAIQEA